MQTDRPRADRPTGTGGWQGTVGQYLVVVAELQRVPLPVAHAPRQVGAHHRAGFPCGDRDKCSGEPGRPAVCQILQVGDSRLGAVPSTPRC